MERRHALLILFFTVVVTVSLAGFFNSYIRFLPATDKFPLIIHIHFTAFISWFVLLILQPILIRKKKYELHRKIGRLSYFIAPILVFTILMLVRNQVIRIADVSASDAAVTAFIGLLDAISFSVYYTIAMINKQNLRWHVAFIIAATLVILNPGLSRLLNHIQPGLGLPSAILLPFIISICIIAVEKISCKRPIIKSPYFFFLCCWIIEIALLITVPSSEAWRKFIAMTILLFE